jgi:predicted nucleic acid-binding protein
VRSGVDCVIAACAIRSRLSVLHRDRDFDKLSRTSPLESRTV